MALISVLVLAGCGSEQKDDIELRGQLTTSNGGDLPADATARISLVQQVGDDIERRIVAEQSIHQIGVPPIAFDLKVGRGLLSQDGRYGLSAEILDGEGGVVWQTPVPQTISPFADKQAPSLLMLQQSVDSGDTSFANYACADQFGFAASLEKKAALVHLGRRQISLTHSKAHNHDAARYADDHNNELTIGKNSAELSVDGATHTNCVVVPDTAPADEVSDATGNEAKPELNGRQDNASGAAGTTTEESKNASDIDQ